MKEEFWCCIIFGTRSNKLSFFSGNITLVKKKQQQMRSTKIIIQIERRSRAEAACSEPAGGSSDREAGRHDQEDHAGDRHQHLRVQVSPLPNQAHQSFSKFLSEQQSRNEMGVLSPYEVALNLERTITVKGPTIDAVSQAESRISQKLRQSFETDLQQRVSGLWGTDRDERENSDAAGHWGCREWTANAAWRNDQPVLDGSGGLVPGRQNRHHDPAASRTRSRRPA